MEAFQLIPADLGVQTWVAGTPLTFTFQNLMPMIGQGIAHTVFIDFELRITPTYTTAPTLVGLHNAFNNMEIFDGERQWLPTGSSFNFLRQVERAENGRIILPDSVTNGASAGLRVIRRRFAWAPQGMYGTPSDAAMPNALLVQGGYARATCGQLTDVSGDTTVVAATLQATAWQARYYNKIIFPGWFERQLQAFSSGNNFQLRALYAWLALAKNTSFAAFTAGDVGNVTINSGVDLPVSSIPAQMLTAAHNADFRVGQLGAVMGDQRSATLDINSRAMNGGTPTALTNEALDLQMLLHAPPDARQTKLMLVPANLLINFSGGGGALQLLMGRYRSLGPSERGVSLQRALSKLPGKGVRAEDDAWGARLADDTSEYKGPLMDFFPWQARVNGAAF